MITFPERQSPEGAGGIETPERFADSPLYEGFPEDYRQTARPFTVTVAGPERHDGEKPYTYVVEAESTRQAWAAALAWHIAEEEQLDAFVVAGESFEGVPAADCGYAWNDLRPELARQRKLDALADEAKELAAAYKGVMTAYLAPDGSVPEGSEGVLREVTNTFLVRAAVMVERLTELTGRK